MCIYAEFVPTSLRIRRDPGVHAFTVPDRPHGFALIMLIHYMYHIERRFRNAAVSIQCGGRTIMSDFFIPNKNKYSCIHGQWIYWSLVCLEVWGGEINTQNKTARGCCYCGVQPFVSCIQLVTNFCHKLTGSAKFATDDCIQCQDSPYVYYFTSKLVLHNLTSHPTPTLADD